MDYIRNNAFSDVVLGGNCYVDTLIFGRGIKLIEQYAFRVLGPWVVLIKDIREWCNMSFFSPDYNLIKNYAKVYFGYEDKEMLSDEAMDIIIPEGVTAIGDYTFYSCNAGQRKINLSIPNSVKASYAFLQTYLVNIL